MFIYIFIFHSNFRWFLFCCPPLQLFASHILALVLFAYYDSWHWDIGRFGCWIFSEHSSWHVVAHTRLIICGETQQTHNFFSGLVLVCVYFFFVLFCVRRFCLPHADYLEWYHSRIDLCGPTHPHIHCMKTLYFQYNDCPMDFVPNPIYHRGINY